MKNVLTLFRAAHLQWRDHNAASMAAALAYYGLVSVVPLIVLASAGLGMFFGQEATLHQVQSQVSRVAGQDIGQFIRDVAVATRHSKNILAAIISALITIIASIGLFNHLKSSLDRMFHAPAQPKIHFTKRFFKNLGLFAILLAIGLLLLGSALLSTAFTVFASNLIHWNRLIDILDTPLFFVLCTLLIAAIYRLLPSVKLPRKELLTGAIATSLLLTIGKLLIGVYFHFKNPGSVYGSASAVVALLLWVYYSAQIFYFGVEFTYIYSKRKQFLNS